MSLWNTKFQLGRIHDLGSQGISAEMTSLTISPSDTLGDFMFHIPASLGSAGLGILIPKEDTLSPGTPQLNYKLWLLHEHCGLLVFRDQQARRGTIILPGVWTLPIQKEEVLHLPNGGRRNPADGPRDLSVLPGPTVTMNGQELQSWLEKE